MGSLFVLRNEFLKEAERARSPIPQLVVSSGSIMIMAVLLLQYDNLKSIKAEFSREQIAIPANGSQTLGHSLRPPRVHIVLRPTSNLGIQVTRGVAGR